MEPIKILKQLAEALEAALERIEELEEELGKSRSELEAWLEAQ